MRLNKKKVLLKMLENKLTGNMRIIYNKIINEFENNGFEEWPLFKSLQITNASEGLEKREPFYFVGGNVSCCSHCGRKYGGFAKN